MGVNFCTYLLVDQLLKTLRFFLHTGMSNKAGRFFEFRLVLIETGSEDHEVSIASQRDVEIR